MESLSKQLYTCVSSAVEQFINEASSELNVDRSQLLTIWNRSVSSELKASGSKPTVSVPTTSRSKPKADPDAKQCVHIGTRGKSKGEQCTSKASAESAKGFCKKHMKGEGSSPKAAATPEKKSAAAKPASAIKMPATNPAINTIKVDSLPIKINKFGNYQNASGLVFDRATHEAYGRQSPDGNVIPLTVDDIRECKQYGFKFRMPEQLKSKEDEGEEEEVEEVEVEEEEEEVEEIEEEEDN